MYKGLPVQPDTTRCLPIPAGKNGAGYSNLSVPDSRSGLIRQAVYQELLRKVVDTKGLYCGRGGMRKHDKWNYREHSRPFERKEGVANGLRRKPKHPENSSLQIERRLKMLIGGGRICTSTFSSNDSLG